jgi:hypothetical protein
MQMIWSSQEAATQNLCVPSCPAAIATMYPRAELLLRTMLSLAPPSHTAGSTACPAWIAVESPGACACMRVEVFITLFAHLFLSLYVSLGQERRSR